MRIRKAGHKHYIEILLAAWLRQRDQWQQAARSLPEGACLLITNPKDKAQMRIMNRLTQLFREKGRRVFTWAAK